MLLLNGREVPLLFVHNPRARRYVLRVRPDGSARLTVPRRGSIVGARQFAERHKAWLQRQLHYFSERPARSTEWTVGTEILFRGIPVKIQADAIGLPGSIRFATESLRVADPSANLRPPVERHLRALATAELPARTLEFASHHRLSVRRVTVRNQKSRWGSCSPRGAISLNWRLIQTPPFVCDYIILHELMHLRQMNHSERFWREVQSVCPGYGAAKRWLTDHPRLLH